MKILVVEDETSLREGLIDLLRGASHGVEVATDGLTAAKLGVQDSFDLVVLDLMLPRLDGAEVCHRIRKARPSVPILMLTAKNSEDDKLRGFNVGADDYLTKPFSPRELLARIDALQRRAQTAPADAEIIRVDGCELDLGRCECRRGKESVTLTPREAGIIRWLYRHRARGVSRAELLEHVWRTSPEMETRTVDMSIAHLRQKIEREPAHPRVIVSVKGIGYAWGDT
jgi:DNA-binding response OmpR family regulator